MKSITNIGRQLLARQWANKIIGDIGEEPAINQLELRARGLDIARAVDVCEILKRELELSKSAIKTNTKEMVSKMGLPVKVSEILITLSKK